MTILNFFNKSKPIDNIPSEFTPKSNVVRGAGGKFVSKKKVVEKKSKPVTSAIGPILVPFDGMLIRRFYAKNKWYFALGDLYLLVHSDPPLKTLNELRDEPKFKILFDKYINLINEVECVNLEGADEILHLVIKEYKALFSGSLFRWLADLSTHEKPEEIKKEN